MNTEQGHQPQTPSRESPAPSRKPYPKEWSSNGFYEQVLGCIGDEVVVINRKGRIVYANAAAAEGLGRSVEKLLGSSIIRFLQQKISLAQWQKEIYDDLLKDRQPVTIEVDRVNSAGIAQTIEVTAVRVMFGGEDLVLSVGRDVTARRRIREQLQESQEEYRTLCEHAGDAILTLSLQGSILYANPVATEYVKVPLTRILDQPFTKFIHPTSLPRAMAAFRRAKKSADRFHEHLEILDSRGEKIPIEISVAPMVQDGKIVSIHIVARDISERIALERLTRESEKMKALQYFLSGTTQELRYPLLAVMRRAEMLSQKYRQRNFEYISYREFSDLLTNLKGIAQQIRHCYNTTERLLTAGKRRIKVPTKRCDANKTLREYLELKKDELKAKGIRLRSKYGSKLPPVTIGPFALTQIIASVVSNAVQAMPGGGELSVSTVRPHGKNMIHLQFRDSGVGIPKDHLKHLFDPFFTTKERGLDRNSGMGLVIVHSLIKEAGGDIRIQSSRRQGTVVHLELPAAVDTPKSSASPKSSKPSKRSPA